MNNRLLPIPLTAVLLTAACTQLPTEPQPRSADDHYTISIPALHQDSVLFSYTVSSGTRFILPYHFFDNPLDSITGSLVSDLSVTDANGMIVDTAGETEQIGPISNRIVILPEGTTFPVTFRYHLDLSAVHRDSADKMSPAVHIRDASLFLIGAYCFILPAIGSSPAELWRTKHPTAITVASAPAITLYGIPSRSFTCASLYELLFLQLSAGKAPVARGHGGGVDFVFIDYIDKSYPSALPDSVTSVFSTILDTIASYFGPLSGSPYTVDIQNIWGGLEGTYGFSISEPWERFGEILTHEALHHFIGIRCGDYDDPWWKESAAAYLGVETAVRLGFYSKEAFKQRMTTRFAYADTARFQHPLSDPWLRSHMFPDTLYALVYDRGAQVMMLLDVQIRRGSDNHSTLLHAIADLCTEYSGRAFNRAAFLSVIERYGSGDAAGIFAAYVDSPDSVMSEEMLNETFDRLDSLAPY